MVIVSIPAFCKFSCTLGVEKRETPITLLVIPARSMARFACLASVGPIFPPTPRMRISPSSAAIAAITASVGSDKYDSNSVSVFIKRRVL